MKTKRLGPHKVITGHFNYYGVPGNKQALDAFRTEAIKQWFRALRSRSQKARRLTWERFKRLIATWVPTVKIMHAYTYQGFASLTQGRSRMR